MMLCMRLFGRVVQYKLVKQHAISLQCVLYVFINFHACVAVFCLQWLTVSVFVHVPRSHLHLDACSIHGHCLAMEMQEQEKEGAAKRRQSFNGSPEELTKCLVRHVARPSDIEYPEAPDCRIDRDKLAPWMAMWQEAVKISPNLSFTPSVMDASLRAMVEHKGFFKKKPHLIPPFIVSASRRLRNMARNIQQARVKQSSWVFRYLQIPEEESVEQGQKKKKKEVARSSRGVSPSLEAPASGLALVEGQAADIKKEDPGDVEGAEAAAPGLDQMKVADMKKETDWVVAADLKKAEAAFDIDQMEAAELKEAATFEIDKMEAAELKEAEAAVEIHKMESADVKEAEAAFEIDQMDAGGVRVKKEERAFQLQRVEAAAATAAAAAQDLSDEADEMYPPTQPDIANPTQAETQLVHADELQDAQSRSPSQVRHH